MDTELDELGEVMTTAQYDELTKAITDQNVALTDQQGQLRNTYDVLRDLSVAWQTMTANEKASLAQMFGSTRNQNVFTGLMENFQEATDAMRLMDNSEGALSEANDTYLESVKAHIQQLKNAYDTLLYDDSMIDFMNQVVDSGKTILDIAGKIVDVINKIGGMRAVLAAVVALIIKSKWDSISGHLTKLGVTLSYLPHAFSAAAKSGASMSSVLTGLGGAATVAKTALGALGIVIGAVVAIVSAVQSAEQERMDAARSTAESYSEMADSVDDYKSKAYDLRKELDSGNLSEDDARRKREELIDIEDSLVTALGKEAGAIELVTGNIKDQIEAIENLEEKKYDEWLNKNESAVNKIQDAFVDYDKGLLSGNDIWTIHIPEYGEVSHAINKAGLDKIPQDFYDALQKKFDELGYKIDLSQIDFSDPYFMGDITANLGITDIYSFVEAYGALQTAIRETSEEFFGNYADSARMAQETSSEFYSSYTQGALDYIKDNEEVFNTYAKGQLVYKQYEETYKNLLNAQNDFRDAKEKQDEDEMRNSIARIKEFEQQLLDDAVNDSVVTTYLKNIFKDINAEIDPISIKLNIKEDLNQNQSIADDITSLLSKGGFVNKDGEVDLELVEHIEYLDGEIPEELKNAALAYDLLSQEAEHYGLATDDDTSAVKKLISVLSELGYVSLEPVVDNDLTLSMQDTIAEFKKYFGEGNIVDVIFRPSADLSDLKSSGWNVDSDSVAGLFAKTFANEDDTVAINFTPVVLDEYGNVQSILTPKELESYAKDVLSGVRQDDLNLQIGAKVEMNDGGAKAEAQKTFNELQRLFDRFNIDFDGSKYESLVKGLTAVESASSRASAALQELNDVIKEPDYNEGLEARMSNYLKFRELFEEGDYGSSHYAGYAKYFGFVDENGKPLSPEEMGQRMAEYEKYVGLDFDEDGKAITNADVALYNWLETVDQLESKSVDFGDGVDRTLGKLISFDKEAGKLKFDPEILFDPKKMETIASEFGMTIENFTDMLNAYRYKSPDWLNFDTTELHNWLTEAELIDTVGDKTVLYVDKLESLLTALGFDYDAIQDIVEQARSLDENDIEIGIKIDENSTPESIANQINEKLNQITENGLLENIDLAAEMLSEIEDMDLRKQVILELVGDNAELEQQINDAIEAQNAEVSVSTDVTTDVDDGLTTIQDVWVDIDGKTLSFTVEATGLSDINDELDKLDERFGSDFNISAQPTQTSFLGNYAQYLPEASESDSSDYKIVMTCELDDEGFKSSLDGILDYAQKKFGEFENVNIEADGEKVIVETDRVTDYIEEQHPEERVDGNFDAVEEGINQVEKDAANAHPTLEGDADFSDAHEKIHGFRTSEEEKPITIQVSAITPEQIQTDIESNQPIDGTPDYYNPGFFDTPVESYSVSPEADSESLNQLTSDIEGAINDADTNITLPSLSDLPKVPEYKMEMEEIAESVDIASESFDGMSSSVSDLNSQDVESANKVSALDHVSDAADNAVDSEENLIGTSVELSNTGIDVSGKTSQLSNLSGSARSTAGNIRQTTNEWYALKNSPDYINKTVTTTYKTLSISQHLAKGTRSAKGGTALLGDEYSPTGQPRPELVVSNGEAFIAGSDGPTLATLNKGDVVYPYDETKKILAGSSIARFPAFAGGSIDYERLYKSVMDRTGGGSANYTDNSTNYNTYNYNAGSDSKSSDTEEEFDWVDWIEVILDRAERAVSDFKKSAESTYNSLKKRLKSTGSEIKAITNEIGLQEQAYQRYMQQANAVGLSSSLAKLVRDGTIDINQYDEATRELISDYQNWYEKCLNCADAIVELHDNLAALYEDNFSNIQNDYENRLERLSFLTNEYNNNTRVINRNRDNTISLLRSELKDLEKSFADAMNSGEIEEYSESWYKMANTIHNVRNQISEAYKEIFSSIEDRYDNQLQSLSHFTNEYNTAMEELSAKGLIESKRFYSALSKIEKQNVSTMTKKLKEMEEALKDAVKNGEIEAYSSSWYDMRMAIDEVKESISEANLKLLEYNKSMRDIDWSYFDYARDRVGKLNEEAEFLIDLMSNDNLYQDNGQFNDKGNATLGLRVQNYDVDMAQADAYGKEIKKINRDIAKDPYNTELIERREELLKLQRDSISAAESEKQAIKSLVEEGIKIELDNLKELIDSYNESLDSAKDLYDYQKKISDQTKNIASLEKQLAAYKNDTSEETRSRVQKISVDLDDARRQLEETQYDKYVSDSKKMLDNLYDEYSDLLNSRLGNVDKLVIDMIDTVNDNSYDIKSTLTDVSDEVGYTITSEMQTIWGGAKDVATYYGEHFNEQFTNINTTLGNIRAFVELLAKNSDKEAANSISSTSSDTSSTNKNTTESTNKRTATSSPKVGSSNGSSAKSTPLTLNRNLSYGSRGDDVKQLQQKLYDLGYLNSAPDGIFGEYTRAAVNAFQIANGLGVDGIVGPHTLAKLNGSPILKKNAATTSVTYSRNLSYGSTGSDVTKLQKRLAELGYYSGAIDGKFGSMTLQAVKDFQTASGIYVDGVVGPVTIKSLNSKSKLGKYMKYATGGLVTRTGLAQLDGTPQKPELVLNARDTENFIALKEALSDLASPLRLASSSTFASALFGGGVNSGTNAVFNGGINIAIDHVEDYDDLVRQIQKDGQFEKMILSMTVDRLAGRSQLEKHKFYK